MWPLGRSARKFAFRTTRANPREAVGRDAGGGRVGGGEVADAAGPGVSFAFDGVERDSGAGTAAGVGVGAQRAFLTNN